MTQQEFKNSVFVLKDKMYRFAKRMLEDNEEAKDAVQEIMIKLWQMKDDLPSFTNIEAFAVKCVKNECLNRLKHAKIVENHRLRQQGFAPVNEKTPDNTRQIIVQIINGLPEKQKMVIHLKDVEEYKINEIAGMLEMNENAVRINLMRARQKVKNKLEKIFAYEKQQINGLEK